MQKDEEWFYEDNGQRVGPVSKVEIVNLINSKKLASDSLIWKNGYSGWVKIESSEFYDHIKNQESPPLKTEPPPLIAESPPLEAESPTLWNPNAIANFSVLFSPIFGAYLNKQNWLALNEKKLARSSGIWFWIGILLAFFILFIPEDSNIKPAAIGLLYLFLWYFLSARKQSTYVKEKYNSDYDRRSWGIPITIAVVTIALYLIIVAIFSSSYEVYERRKQQFYGSETPTEIEFRDSGKMLDYRKAVLNEYNKGDLLIFTGRLNQIIDDDMAMIQTESNIIFGYAGNPLLLVFSNKPEVITDDVVKIYGRYSGTQKYETILGQAKEVPLVKVDYYYIQDVQSSELEDDVIDSTSGFSNTQVPAYDNYRPKDIPSNKVSEEHEKIGKSGEKYLEEKKVTYENDQQYDVYVSEIRSRIFSNWSKPTGVESGIKTTLRIKLFPDGTIGDVSVTRTSGSPAYDRSAIDAVKKASPLPVPKGIAFDKFRILSINF